MKYLIAAPKVNVVCVHSIQCVIFPYRENTV